MGLTNTPSDLLPGTLELLVLKALAGGPKHGYGIAQYILVSSGHVLEVGDAGIAEEADIDRRLLRLRQPISHEVRSTIRSGNSALVGHARCIWRFGPRADPRWRRRDWQVLFNGLRRRLNVKRRKGERHLWRAYCSAGSGTSERLRDSAIFWNSWRTSA
jgi:hypothetical protein